MPESKPAPHPNASCLRAALERLRSGERSRAELRGWLRDKGFGEPEVESVLSHLVERGLQSDTRLAESIAAHYSGRNSIGRDLLRNKLTTRKIANEVIEELLSGRDVEAEKRALLQAVERRAARADPPEKTARFLASRGFDEEVIEGYLEALQGTRPPAIEP